jgi:hypothetical protein
MLLPNPSPETQISTNTARIDPALFLALGLSLLFAANMLGPALLDPSGRIVGNWNHPDCLGNHWLLVWVAERILSFESLLHNPTYYAPFGDAPWLAGNGSEGILYAPFHALWGWPVGANRYLFLICTFNGLGAYALGRNLNGGRFGSLLVLAAVGCSPYVTQELSSGRFSQANLGFFLITLALFFRILEKPTKKCAIALALCGAATCLFYFYYAFFIGLIGLIVLGYRWFQKKAIPREFWIACAFGLALTLPLFWIYASHWDQIPGTSEAVFPHPESFLHASGLSFKNLINGEGRLVAMSQPIILMSLAAYAVLKGRNDSKIRLLFVLVIFAWILCLGPQGKLYNAIYGIHPALQRFWWPTRHALILTVMMATLATHALPNNWEKRVWPVLLITLSVPLSLQAQGLILHAKSSPIELPPALYTSLSEEEGEVLLQTPLNPRATSIQTPMIYQLFHKKKMINGHAPWVDRVRPAAWDALISENTFLSALNTYEMALTSGQVNFNKEDLNALREMGLRYLIVDQEFYVLKLRPLAAGTRLAFQDLFGPPVLQGKRSWVFDIDQWNQQPFFNFTPWKWPKGLRPSQDGQVLNGRRPPSVLFSPKASKDR